MRKNLVHKRRARLAVAGEAAGGEEQPGGAVAQHIVVVHRLATQLRHRHRVHLRRRRPAVAQQFARVLALAARATEILAEAAGFKLHVGAAFVALQHRAVVALDAETAALRLDAGAVGIGAADMQLAPLVDQITVHRGVATRATAARSQLARLGLLVGVFADRLVPGDHVQRVLAPLFGRQRVAGAAEEHPGAARAQLHRPPAIGAGDVGHRGVVAAHAAHVPLRGLQAAQELVVELIQQALPVQLPGGDFVEMLLHRGGEAVVQQVGETFLQALGHDVAHLLGVESLVLQPHIAAILNRGDDRGVSGGAAYAALFQLAHEAGLAVSRRRLGEVLLGLEFDQGQGIALLQIRQDDVLVFLARRRQHFGVAVELNHAPFGGEFVLSGGAFSVPRGRRHRRGKIPRRRHLACHEAPPDQLVESRRVALRARQAIMRQRHRRRADRLVGFLRAFLGGVHIGGLRQIRRREGRGDVVAALPRRVRAEVGGIGSHISDMAGLVETLGQGHGFLDAEAEPGARGLLQGGGDERRRRARPRGLVLAAADFVVGLIEGRHRRHRGLYIGGPERLPVLLQHLKAGLLPGFVL